MKVLITTDCYKPTINGVVTSIENLKEGLEALGDEVRILSLSSTKKTYSQDGIYYIGSIDISKIYPGVRLRTKRGNKEIKDIMDWEPDIIHTQSEFSTFPLAKKIGEKLSIPLVHTYHTVYEDYTHYFSPSETLGRKAVSRFTNMVGKRVGAMIAPTHKTERILESYGLTCPVEVIPSGITLDKFNQVLSNEDLQNLKAKYDIPEENRLLVSVSRVSKEKNIDELIRYMNKTNYNDLTLLVVGDGPERKHLEESVRELQMEDKVRFTGMINPKEIHKYYQMADIFVSASTSETQGLTYIEALASGIPILCRLDDCLEGVLEENKNGYSFENQDEFLECLDKMLEMNQYKRLQINARESVRKFSKESFSNRVHLLYKDMIQKNRMDISGEEVDQNKKRVRNIASFGFIAILAMLTIFAYRMGYFSSIEELQALVASVGIWGPIIFILIQMQQVIFPFIPGGLGCLAGVILFGPLAGFAYNYIGIVMGSFVVFGLSKHYGKSIINFIFPKVLTDKYFRIMEQKEKFKKWFAIAIFSPVAPDDLLCYIAGTTRMKWKEFITIIVFGKPFSIAAYSMGLATVFNKVIAIGA